MIAETKKREIEVMLAEYREDVEKYRIFMEDWKKRSNRLRCLQRLDGMNSERTPTVEG
jgi:hypothetical protein